MGHMISKFEENYGTLISKKSTVSHFHQIKCIYVKVIGIQPTLHVLSCESFPTNIRATSHGIIYALQQITIMVNQKLFPIVLSTYGFYTIVYFYATVVALFTTYGWLTMKETDKLSLSEVQVMFNKKEEPKTSSYGTVTTKLR